MEKSILCIPQESRWSNWTLTLFVPKSELKNFDSKFAEDINRQYSQVASDAIDRYVNQARPTLPGAEDTAVFFLGAAAAKRQNADYLAAVDYKLSRSAVDRAIRKHLITYFGQGQGVNIFRHMLATSILKDAPTRVDIAAAVLNNSEQAIRASYKHLTQFDSLRSAESWFDAQRKRRQERKG